MKTDTLRSLGIETLGDIPAAELFSASIDAPRYGLCDEGLKRLSLLCDFVSEYNREMECEASEAITCARQAARMMHADMSPVTREEVWVLMLTKANTPILRKRLFIGGLDTAVIDQRLILKEALLCGAAGFILLHTHPSGKAEPSTEDIRMTERLRDACRVMDLTLVDHIVMAERRWYSFAEQGGGSFR